MWLQIRVSSSVIVLPERSRMSDSTMRRRTGALPVSADAVRECCRPNDAGFDLPAAGDAASAPGGCSEHSDRDDR